MSNRTTAPHVRLQEAKKRIAELEAQLAEAHVLLSQWYETWNDGFNPSGDLLDDTHKALAGEEE